DAMHGTAAAAPAYRRFVTIHVNAMSMAHMDWAVHSMNMGGVFTRGRNFLDWHRRLQSLFEQRLQVANPAVTGPNWDSVTDRHLPTARDNPELLNRWSVSRSWDASQLAAPSDLTAVQNYTGSFTGFQTLFEGTVHAGTHNAVGGDMAGAASPTDPLFWLH